MFQLLTSAKKQRESSLDEIPIRSPELGQNSITLDRRYTRKKMKSANERNFSDLRAPTGNRVKPNSSHTVMLRMINPNMFHSFIQLTQPIEQILIKHS